MNEIWKPIEGYEGKYMISNFGRVKSLKNSCGNYREKILKPLKSKKVYLQVNLSLNGKVQMFKIHRLVAEAFLPNPDDLEQVNHKDENKLNNCVENLEWCDNRYNVRYTQAKKVGCYKNNKLIKIYNAISDTELDGFKKSAVCQCCKGKLKNYKGYQWIYID